MNTEAFKKQLAHDFDKFDKMLDAFDVHFISKGRRANYKMLAPNLLKLVEESVQYIDDDVIDVAPLSYCVPRNQHDKELYRDIVAFVYEHFKEEPASNGTIAKFRDCLSFYLSTVGF